MKKKIFTAEYVSGDKSFSAVFAILAHDTEEALNMGWDSFDHKDGNFNGHDPDASLIITSTQPYKKDVIIDVQ